MESPAINRSKLEFKVRFACWIHPMYYLTAIIHWKNFQFCMVDLRWKLRH